MELQHLPSLRAATDAPDLAAPHEAAQRRAARRFDDILGQTLAGPLFATWTPNAPVNPVPATPSSTAGSVSALDPDARRGRKRPRR